MTVDPAAELKLAKASLEKADGDSEDDVVTQEKVQVLDVLTEMMENMDVARDLHKVSGLLPLISTLKSKHGSLRWRAADALATCTQNHPECQVWACEFGAMAILRDMVPADVCPKAQTKALAALSST